MLMMLQVWLNTKNWQIPDLFTSLRPGYLHLDKGAFTKRNPKQTAELTLATQLPPIQTDRWPVGKGKNKRLS